MTALEKLTQVNIVQILLKKINKNLKEGVKRNRTIAKR